MFLGIPFHPFPTKSSLSSLHFLLRKILLSSFLSKARLDLSFFEDAYHHMVWWVKCLWYLGLKNISHAGPGDNVSSPHSTFKSSPEVRKPRGLTISFGVQGSLKDQCSPTRAHMWYRCFCPIVNFMIPKFN